MAQETDKRISAYRNTFKEKLNDDQIAYLFKKADLLKLDPLLKEISMYIHDGKPVLITTIDGYRKVTNSKKSFRGYTMTMYGPEATFERLKETWDPREQSHIIEKVSLDLPNRFIVGIIIKDFPTAVYGDILTEEYLPETLTAYWLKKPNTQLAKIAEAQAHRRLNPDLGSVYITEEFDSFKEPEKGSVKPTDMTYQAAIKRTLEKVHKNNPKAISEVKKLMDEGSKGGHLKAEEHKEFKNTLVINMKKDAPK